MGELFLYLGVTVVATAIIWWGSDMLEKAAGKLSSYYRLPAVVHGAVVVAIGSSFPELSSTVLSTLLHDEFELGLSAVIGSAIFNILVIGGLSGLFSKGGLQTDKQLVYKDAQFYLISVAVLVVTFTLAVIYFPAPDQPLSGTLHRGFALFPVMLYGLYLFIQQQETADYQRVAPPAPDLKPSKHWGMLGLSLLLIVGGVEGLVRAALFFGEYFNTPSFLWGILVIASVTSLPDLLISVRLARRGEGVPSLSNVLGSNIFDLLVAVPAGVLIAGSALIDLRVAIPLMAFLTIGTIQLFASMRTRLQLGRRESWWLLVTYGVFIVWIVLETAGVTEVIKQ